jgi:hypothetical protein
MNSDLLDDIRLLAECGRSEQNQKREQETHSRGTAPYPAEETGRRSHLKMAENVDNLNAKLNESAIIRYVCTRLKSRERFEGRRDA